MSDTPESKKPKNPMYDTAMEYEDFVADVMNHVKLRCNFCGGTEWDTAHFDNKRVKVLYCDLCHKIEDDGSITPILHS